MKTTHVQCKCVSYRAGWGRGRDLQETADRWCAVQTEKQGQAEEKQEGTRIEIFHLCFCGDIWKNIHLCKYRVSG